MKTISTMDFGFQMDINNFHISLYFKDFMIFQDFIGVEMEFQLLSYNFNDLSGI